MKNGVVFIIVFLLMMSAVQAVEYGSATLKVTLLNQEPDPARAGDTVNLRLRVENIGAQPIENLELEVIATYPFTVIDGPALRNIGTLYAYQTDKNYINTEYKLKIEKDVVNGKHELKVRYRQSKNVWVTASFNIEIKSKEFAQIIYVDKAKIEPGKETGMKFTITNIGSAPLQNLVFSWSEPTGILLPVFSDDTKYIKYLDIGDSTELNYTVIADVNAKPGLYQMDLNLRYESLTNSTATVIKTKAGIFVGGETSFDIAFSESTQGQTSLSVANTGNNPALSVSVRIPEQSGFRVTGSNSAIIGNLDKGDYTIVSFQIVQSSMFNNTQAPRQGRGQRTQNGTQSTQAGNGTNELNNRLRVVIDYTDTTGERRSIEKIIPAQFRAGAGGGATYTGQFQRSHQTSFWQSYWFYGFVILTSFGAFMLYKKKSLREKIAKMLKGK